MSPSTSPRRQCYSEFVCLLYWHLSRIQHHQLPNLYGSSSIFERHWVLPRNEELQRLLKIEKSLVFFITSLRGNDNLLIKMKTLKVQRQFFDEDLVEDVEIELRQAQDSARIYSDILSGTMDAYASVISNNLNIVMKRMTSISIILMLPTLIASLYGMNVPNSLEENPYGFLIVIVISILFSVFGFIVFKWRHWF